MSDVLKFSGPIKVGSLSGDPSNPTEGYIYFNTSSGVFRMYENGAFRDISAEQLEAHLDGGASKHDATEIDYERTDGSKKNIDAASDDVETALTDLDDAIGSLAASPTNYTPSDASIVADHLAGIDSALASVSNDAADVTYTPNVLTDWDGDADPGNVDDALDQLAERVDDNEIAISGNTSDISDNTSDIADIRTTQGTSDGDTDLGTFTGSTISDTTTVKGALQELETAHEATDALIDGHLDGTANKHDADEIDYERTDGSKVDIQAASDDVESALTDLDDNKISRTGSVAFTGDQSMGSNKITDLATPTADTDAATKAYVDATAQGLDVKESVRVATTAPGTLASDFEDGDTVDGVTLATGDRILIKDQASGAENGIYVVEASGSPTRATDADTSPEVTAGMFVFVEEGTANADTGWVLTTDNPITLGSTALAFSQFSGAGSIVAGDGLDKTGNTLSVNVDDSTIEINADALRVKAAGISDNEVATGIDAAKLADGSVSNTEFQYLGNVTSDIQTQLDAKLENIVEDTSPELGGDLDVGGFAIEDPDADLVLAGQDSVRRAKQASKSNFVEEEYIHSISLSGSQSGTTINDLTFAHATYEGCEIVYKLKEATSNDVRIGTIRVVTNGTSVVLNDASTESADTGISFSAVVNGANIEIRYDSGTNGATMRADVKRMLA